MFRKIEKSSIVIIQNKHMNTRDYFYKILNLLLEKINILIYKDSIRGA